MAACLCVTCKKPLRNVTSCSICLIDKHCSKECLEADKEHKQICKPASETDKRLLTTVERVTKDARISSFLLQLLYGGTRLILDNTRITFLSVLSVRTKNKPTEDIVVVPVLATREQFYTIIDEKIANILPNQPELIPFIFLRVIDLENGKMDILKSGCLYLWDIDMPGPGTTNTLTKENMERIWFYKEKVRNMCLQMNLIESQLIEGAFIFKEDTVEFNTDILGRMYNAVGSPKIQDGNGVTMVVRPKEDTPIKPSD